MIYAFVISIAAGMACLALSLPSIASILHTLDGGRLYDRWCWLRQLILVFLVGYALLATLRIGQVLLMADIVVAAILCAGGAFVLIVARLSDMTTRDIVRIAALERDVMHDPLTGLFNRRYLDEKLPQEAEKSQRTGHPLSAIIVDLDHFKHVNDTYGHAIGDLVLRHVATLLDQRAESSDTIARYGGEEFVVIASDRDLDAAKRLGEDIRLGVAGEQIALPDGRTLTVTTSLGIATLTAHESASHLLQRADEALYEAKRTGRNRACISSPIEPAGPRSNDVAPTLMATTAARP